jgi:hypothetical protein
MNGCVEGWDDWDADYQIHSCLTHGCSWSECEERNRFVTIVDDGFWKRVLTFRDEDYRVDIYRNWVDNPMVKVTHLPSGIVETCDMHKSERDNREIAKNRIAVKLGVARPDGGF